MPQTEIHKFAHYQFEMEIHPDDDPEGLKKMPQTTQPSIEGE
jgi:hypothetical protein